MLATPVGASLIVRCEVRAAFSQHFTTEDELTNFVDYLCGLGYSSCIQH